MQEQNFEKQVQHTLDELSLTPSAPVWQKVEKEIRQKKKRRRVLVFWLFAALLIGGGAFWGLYSTSGLTSDQTIPALLGTTNPSQQQPTNTTSKAAITNTDRKEQTPVATTTTTVQNSNTPASSMHERSFAGTATQKTSVAEKQVLTVNTPEAKSRKKQNHTAYTRKTTDPKVKQSKVADAPFIDTEETIVGATTNPKIKEDKSSSSNQSISSQTSDTAATSITVEPSLTQLEATIPAVESTQSKKAQKKTAKWSLAAEAGYGFSSLQEGFLSSAKAAPEVYSSPLLNSGSPTSPAQNRFSSSGIEKGAAFHITLSVKRHLNKRFAVTAGLQYSYFATKNKVGQTVIQDTILRRAQMESVALDQYFRAAPPSGPLKEYTNKYHFAELPAGIEWQLHRRLPLHLQTGVSLSYLMATNALIFDPTAGIYYKSDEQFRKAQLHIYNGLTYRVWQHKKFGVHVGPYLQFGISGLQKANTSRHLLATGLKTQVAF